MRPQTSPGSISSTASCLRARRCRVCLLENHGMQRLARKHDAVLEIEPGEVCGRITHPWPSYLSVMEEAAADGRALFRATFGVG